MLGRHPANYATPETNLLVGAEVTDLYDEVPKVYQNGLLRTIAQLYTGEQTIASIETARRWLYRRALQSTKDVYDEVCRKIAPLRLVDKSTLYTDPSRPDILERIKGLFPDAYYLHLLRHPRAQCQSWVKQPTSLKELIALDARDRAVKHTTIIDPQFDWFNRQTLILRFLDTIREERRMRLHSEELINEEPRDVLRSICKWLGEAWDDAIYQRMLETERASYSCTGPYGAEGGNSSRFQSSPTFRRQPKLAVTLTGRLVWRPDEEGFTAEVTQLARRLGYS